MLNEELQYHIQMKTGDVGRYVLLPGDPGRCEKIASYFDNPELVAHNREHKTYTGTLLGEKVSVVSTGMGCPSTAIAVEELIKIGADTFIRVGTSGAMQPDINTGDVAVVSAAIRDEGTTLHYLPIEFPAIADVDVVLALSEGARRAGIPSRVGVTQSKDSFYGEVEPDRMPMADMLKDRWKAWVGGGAICSEMEASAIFILSSIYRKRAGGAMLMVGMPDVLPEDEEELKALMALVDVERPIKVAIEGLKVLIEQDRNKK
ncbi:MAG: nucleoside phosphorylase [Anaerolineaceae bacterium]|nr:nucleoside phosphorylase [Anaerolineaceae bacterium]